jgi:hypothetical protein
VNKAEQFREEALALVKVRIESLRATLDFPNAMSLPEAHSEDVVVAGREVQLTVFRQANVPFLAGRVLVTVQVARHSLGGIVQFRVEQGLVFSPDKPPRDATDQELRDSGA